MKKENLDNGWKLRRLDGRVWIVPDHSVARAFLAVFFVLFLIVVWGYAIANGLSPVALKSAQALTLIHGGIFASTLVGLWRGDKRGNYVEPAGAKSIRIPRQGITLKFDEVDSIQLREGRHEDNEVSCDVLALWIGTSRRDAADVHVMTTSDRATLIRAAEALAEELGV